MKKKFWKIGIPLGIVVLGFLSMQVLTAFRKEPERREARPRPKIVDARVIQLEDVPSRIIAFGRMITSQPVALISEVTGELQPGSVPFQPGQNFRKGDLLVKVDDRQIRLDINSAKSDLLNALAQVLPEIKVDFPDAYPAWQEYFNQIVFDKALPPLPAAENQRIKLFLSRFNVYKLYFAVRNLEIRLDRHYFYAPFDGAITATDLRIGATARGGSRLGEIINLETLEVEVPLPAQDISWIQRDMPVVFTSSEVRGRWQGVIKRIGRNIDPQTQSVPVYISLDESHSDHIYEGVFLRADIPGKVISNAVSIPNKAVYNDRFVYLIENGRLKYQEVEIARREVESVIVTGGLRNNDTLVTELMQGVAPGMLARPRLLTVSERSRR